MTMNPAASPAARTAPPPDHDRLLGRALDLAPVFAERAARTEEHRSLPPENEADLHESRLYRMLQPRRVGGSECDYTALVTLGAAGGRGWAAVRRHPSHH